MDIAVLCSHHMTGEKTVFMGLGKNRSLDHLQLNSYAVSMIIEPGKPSWTGGDQGILEDDESGDIRSGS